MDRPQQSEASRAATEQATSGTVDPTLDGAADNPFIPQNVNLGDCVSSLPRPDCGSDAQGGPLQYATFGALMAGMVFIGWRIFRGVRRREAVADGAGEQRPSGERSSRTQPSGEWPSSANRS